MRRSRLFVASTLASVLATVGTVASTPLSADGAVATYKLSYASLPNGSKPVIRWNGCQAAITYKVNLASVPASLRTTILSETKGSVAKISKATGIAFSYKGSTTEVPKVGSMAKQTAEIIIAFTTTDKTSYALSGPTLGEGGYSYAWASRTVSGKTSYYVAIRRGFVVIDTPQMLKQTAGGFGPGARRTNLLLHELGHAMGLQHVTDTRQQMYPSLRSTSPSGLAAGDLAGLAKVGRAAGCLNTAYLPLKDLS
jgi:hypothetical protein